MKKVLIISPHFPPVNAPDMQRVRMSLPYYKELGWEPVVLCVNEKFVSSSKDALLEETVPDDVEVYKVNAWPEKLTRRLGIGSLSVRSYYQFKKAGTKLLSGRKFDLVFFSTTLFHVCALGPYWQRKFGVPFIVDMHDPWRNDFFLGKPRSQRPPKFWLAHTIDTKMEAYTMPHAGGILSVSQAYIDTLRKRYPSLHKKPALLLPFGVSASDFQFVKSKKIAPQILQNKGTINVVYVGAVNKFFLPVIKAFFIAFKNTVPDKERYHFYFIGTNYAQSFYKSIEELGKELQIENLITEVPQRISYFAALSTLMHADILFIPGSSDADYNPSKIYNNIFSGKPIFSIFNEKSLVSEAVINTRSGMIVTISAADSVNDMVQKIERQMPEFTSLHHRKIELDDAEVAKLMAASMAQKQTGFFNQVLLAKSICLLFVFFSKIFHHPAAPSVANDLCCV